MKVLVRSGAVHLLNALICVDSVDLHHHSVSGVFSMDEDSLSRDCEPFFESDGEEESTDGKSVVCTLQVVTGLSNIPIYFSTCPRLVE